MEQRPSIVLGRMRHHGNACISLRFEKDYALIREVKKIPGATFSWTKRCWYVPDEEGVPDMIRKALQGKANIDDTALLNINPGSVDALCDYREQLERMRYSGNTQTMYVHYFERFLRYFHDTAADEISDDQIHRYMQQLLHTKKISVSVQNLIINAIKFFYERVRKRERKVYALERPLKEQKLPIVLSEEEVAAILRAMDNLKHRTMLRLIYAAGLRRSELVNLRVTDIDRQRRVINIRGGKGKKDRITLLSEKFLVLMDEYLAQYAPRVWLFEGSSGEQYSASSLQKVFGAALRKSGITKEATLHTLRHSFATHLLESGTDIRYIQALLGHNSSRTTEIYTHVTTKGIDKIKSPLDNLDL